MSQDIKGQKQIIPSPHYFLTFDIILHTKKSDTKYSFLFYKNLNSIFPQILVDFVLEILLTYEIVATVDLLLIDRYKCALRRILTFGFKRNATANQIGLFSIAPCKVIDLFPFLFIFL